MNEPENKFGGPADSWSEELRNELQSLRTLLSAALVLLIVFSACMDYFLSAQTTEMRRALYQDQQLVNNFSANSTRAAEFWGKLVEYSKTHPDFVPIIDKWKANISIHTNGPPPRAK